MDSCRKTGAFCRAARPYCTGTREEISPEEEIQTQGSENEHFDVSPKKLKITPNDVPGKRGGSVRAGNIPPRQLPTSIRRKTRARPWRRRRPTLRGPASSRPWTRGSPSAVHPPRRAKLLECELFHVPSFPIKSYTERYRPLALVNKI